MGYKVTDSGYFSLRINIIHLTKLRNYCPKEKSVLSSVKMFLKINELFPVLMIAKASHEFEMD